MADLLTTAEGLFKQGNLLEAEKIFLKLVDKQPESRAFNNLGVIAYQKGELNNAINYFKQALETNSENIDAIFNLCNILASSSKIAIAYPYLKPLVIKYPDNQEIKKLYDAAETEYKKLREKENKNNKTTSEIDITTKKVLHGTNEIANQMFTTASALKKIDVQAETISYYPDYMKFRSDYVVDLNKIAGQNQKIIATKAMAEKLIPEYDIFHFHFGTTLAYDYSDLEMIKQAGKKMVMQYWGSEIRMHSRAKKINPYAPEKAIDEKVIIRNVKFIASHISHCIVADHELFEYVKDYFENVHLVRTMIDLDRYQPVERPEGKKFLIVHAPTAPIFKGTPYVVKAINSLQSQFDFEFKLIQKMPHEEAKTWYRKADLVIDELRGGTYGLLSVECMAMGKPVITWICDYMRDRLPDDLPIISANIDTVRDKILFALNNRDMLEEIGMVGRKYVEKHHDMNVVVKKLVDVYRKLYE